MLKQMNGRSPGSVVLSGLLTAALVLIAQSTTQGALYSDWVGTVGPEGGAATTTVRLVRQTSGSGQSRTYGTTTGGEFRVEVKVNGSWETLQYTNTNDADWLYKTFCLEKNETIYLNTAYTATIDDAAWYGKNLRSGSTSPEPILAESALLYGLYFEGRLASESGIYNYETNSSANDLQNALWAFEEGTTLSSGQSGYNLWNWAKTQVTNNADFGLSGTVKVLNIWKLGTTSGEGNAMQSQFIYIPGGDGGDGDLAEVPEPASLAMWSVLALAGIAPLRRRLRTARR